MSEEKNFSDLGARLREERERLGLSQEEFGSAGGVTRRTVTAWERGDQCPNAAFLGAIAGIGADVLYLVTGKHFTDGLDALSRAVLDSFRRCSPEKQIEAVQYMALLAAGVAPGPSGESEKTVTKAKVSKSVFGVAIGNVVGKKRTSD